MDKNPVKSDKPPVYIHRTEAEKTEIIMVRVPHLKRILSNVSNYIVRTCY